MKILKKMARIALATCIVVALSLHYGSNIGAQSQTVDPALAAVMQKLVDDPTTPAQYSAAVKLHVKLRIFPFISLTLKGNSVYKRPGLYHFVFRGVPKAVEHFSDLAYDLGNPNSWVQKYTISLLTPPSAGVDPVLRLIPKRHGMVKALDVAVNMEKGHIMKAVWSRFDGGTISLAQHYNTVGTHELVREQNATIDIPHMKAELVADYSAFNLYAGGFSLPK
ncbi:MAG: hypothetical protein M3Z14_07980 [Candidatus Eremiobacteraeota bacterium]|nr:hypothetical protein [Candidatus Eremiobacteraeota bacterium]